eukprot:scaffold34167_cov70-Phaeocystis_antarctica.AAC.4
MLQRRVGRILPRRRDEQHVAVDRGDLHAATCTTQRRGVEGWSRRRCARVSASAAAHLPVARVASTER